MFNLLPASKAPHFTTEWDGLNAKVYLTERIIFSLRSKNFNDYLVLVQSLLFNDSKIKILVASSLKAHSISVKVIEDHPHQDYHYNSLDSGYSEGLLFQLIKIRALIDVIKVGFRDFTSK
ncbi:hypothetical protein ACEYW6_10460 [Nostoc sp. UIC 10607]|uniref:hypothetical protein n=1 Tax=Nostoc sp. UIC 10607 TaxID=3045935 RepID=UPI00399FBE41